MLIENLIYFVIIKKQCKRTLGKGKRENDEKRKNIFNIFLPNITKETE